MLAVRFGRSLAASYPLFFPACRGSSLTNCVGFSSLTRESMPLLSKKQLTLSWVASARPLAGFKNPRSRPRFARRQRAIDKADRPRLRNTVLKKELPLGFRGRSWRRSLERKTCERMGDPDCFKAGVAMELRGHAGSQTRQALRREQQRRFFAAARHRASRSRP